MLAAEIRGSPEHHRPPDRPAAARAALPLLAVMDQVLRRVIPSVLVAHHCLAQDAAHGGEERALLRFLQALDGAARMNGGLEERLVDIEVPETGEDLLGHQQRLDRAAASFE